MAQIIISSIIKQANTHLVAYTADFSFNELFYQTSTDNLNWSAEVVVQNTVSPISIVGIGNSSFSLRLGTRKSVRSNVYGPQYQ